MHAHVRYSVVCVSFVGHESENTRLTQHALSNTNSVTVSIQTQSVEVGHYTEEEEGILWFIVLNG